MNYEILYTALDEFLIDGRYSKDANLSILLYGALVDMVFERMSAQQKKWADGSLSFRRGKLTNSQRVHLLKEIGARVEEKDRVAKAISSIIFASLTNTEGFTWVNAEHFLYQAEAAGVSALETARIIKEYIPDFGS